MMVVTEGSVIYPAVVVNVNKITCRALLDTGARRSYGSSANREKVNKQPVRKQAIPIEMMMHSTVRKIDMFEVETKDLSGRFQFKSEVSQAERKTLPSLPNPNYEADLKQHHHLRNITIMTWIRKQNYQLIWYLVQRTDNDKVSYS